MNRSPPAVQAHVLYTDHATRLYPVGGPRNKSRRGVREVQMHISARKKQPPDIPGPTIRRLTMYLAHVRELRQRGVRWAHSHDIADALCLTTSTVRQDLTHVDFSGIGKRGYDIGKLEKAIGEELGEDRTANVLIVGAGNLGRALALHGEFEPKGFVISAVFDWAPAVIGTKIGRFVVKPMKELRSIVRAADIDIGIIAVPGPAAQGVANSLANAGVRGVLNLSSAHICVPQHVAVVEARIIPSLQELLHLMKAKSEARGRSSA